MTSASTITCTITNTRQTGTLTISKVLSPALDPGKFNLLIDGSSPNAGSNNVGNGGTTGRPRSTPAAIPSARSPGTAPARATTPAHWAAATAPAAAASGLLGQRDQLARGHLHHHQHPPDRHAHDHQGPEPASDPGLFNLQIDGSSPNAGSQNVGNGGTTGPTSVNTGSHTFGEVAHSGTSLGDYTSSWSCSDGTSGSGTGSSVSVTSSPAVTCTITNTRKTGTLTISKVLSPASDPGRFDLQIDGSSPNAGSQNVGNGGTTGPTSVNTGSHTFGEVAHSGTSLGDYTSSWSCSDGTSSGGARAPRSA